MKIFAISDLHLSLASNKPMDVFGEKWAGHADKIRENWLATVGADDLVLLCGDLSWGMRMADAQPDLDWVRALPGKKVHIKGNHDYWWSGIKKVREAGAGMQFIQNDALAVGPVAIGGTRLWDFPFVRWPAAPGEFTPREDASAKADAGDAAAASAASGGHGEVDDEKVRKNELERLQMSLRLLSPTAALRVCMLHYPPLSRTPEENELTALLSEYRIDLCVYGHIHALRRENPVPAADCVIGGVRYVLASCDWLDFRPLLLREV